MGLLWKSIHDRTNNSGNKVYIFVAYSGQTSFPGLCQNNLIERRLFITETILAKNIFTADEKANYDASCKRLLAEKIILAWIMKSCLWEYADCDVNEIAEKYMEEKPQIGEIPVAPDERENTPLIQGTGVEDTTITEGTVTFDIRFTATVPSAKEKLYRAGEGSPEGL